MVQRINLFTTNQSRKALNSPILIIFIFAFTFFSVNTAVGQDEECDNTLTYDNVTNRICVPNIETTSDYILDGNRGDWLPANYYVFTEYAGTTQAVQAFVSCKKRGYNKTDLFLFFEVSQDGLGTMYDEIRIGLNPGLVSDNNTLIKIYPWLSASSVVDSVYDYNSGAGRWDNVTSTYATRVGKFVKYEHTSTEYWSVEMKIQLDSLPNPITGTDFRLYMELQSDVGGGAFVNAYAWPPHYVSGEHNYICANPQRWHPMNFGSGCFADVSIANGLYSCGDIYIKRGGSKSTDIYVNQTNEFHADVTGDLSKNATDIKVYMTILQLGISTAPIAMNYNNTDTNIKNWFQQKWGTWLLATDKLDSGTPKPPTSFNVNAGSLNTDARFNWKPSDETRFGTPAEMVGSHKCTAAFVDYKDDPNMNNNCSYCERSIRRRKIFLPVWCRSIFCLCSPSRGV
jgi:hypothetical protein